jgi:DNA-binding XRE family transcriptional regulator
VSRQTIYALEAGTFAPNTAVALRPAKALDTSVEELFSLADGAPAPILRSKQASLASLASSA